MKKSKKDPNQDHAQPTKAFVLTAQNLGAPLDNLTRENMYGKDALNVYVCPVCGYNELPQPPYDSQGCASFDICPCCGTEFGYDDASRSHDELRKNWIRAGSKWMSTVTKQPHGWTATDQLENLKQSS